MLFVYGRQMLSFLFYSLYPIYRMSVPFPHSTPRSVLSTQRALHVQISQLI